MQTPQRVLHFVCWLGTSGGRTLRKLWERSSTRRDCGKSPRVRTGGNSSRTLYATHNRSQRTSRSSSSGSFAILRLAGSRVTCGRERCSRDGLGRQHVVADIESDDVLKLPKYLSWKCLKPRTSSHIVSYRWWTVKEHAVDSKARACSKIIHGGTVNVNILCLRHNQRVDEHTPPRFSRLCSLRKRTGRPSDSSS